MKNRIVIWGTNDQNERVLIAMELKPHDNKVEILTYPENLVTEEFNQRMMDVWREGKPMDLPEGHTVIERELTVADSILPEHLKVEKSDIINRAQTEWHFNVLSVKLHETYKAELAELKEQVDHLAHYDPNVWDSLKAFWEKVQNQVRDRHLFREQADSLRDAANELFNQLKEMRIRGENDFKTKSRENLIRFQSMIEDVEARAAKGIRLQPLFDELKNMQQKFKEYDFTREDRNKLWNRIDEAFKRLKGKREGDDSANDRLQKRYNGLIEAIARMQDSIRRDRQELDFQSKKIAATDGQLEAQIRQAKIKMVEERLRSKEEKLKEMTDTQVELERKLQAQAEREARREKIEEAKRVAEQKIRESAQAAVAAHSEHAEKLEKAAEAIQQRKGKKGAQLFEAATTVLGDVLMDALDTAKAVAEVAKENLGEIVEEIKEEAGELGGKAKETMADFKEDFEELGEKLRDKVEEIKGEVQEFKAEILEKAEDWKAEAEQKASEWAAKAEEVAESAATRIQEIKADLEEKVASLAPNLEMPNGDDAPTLHEDPASSAEGQAHLPEPHAPQEQLPTMELPQDDAEKETDARPPQEA